jgi:hypothetical protein
MPLVKSVWLLVKRALTALNAHLVKTMRLWVKWKSTIEIIHFLSANAQKDSSTKVHLYAYLVDLNATDVWEISIIVWSV